MSCKLAIEIVIMCKMYINWLIQTLVQCLISVLCDQAKELKMKGESEVNNFEGNQNVYENEKKLKKAVYLPHIL